MSFAKPIFTTRGKQIELQGIEGQQIIFTKIKIGDGRITTQSPSQLTDLINVIAEAPITSLKRYDAYAAIRSVFQNIDVPEAFWWREVGLFATDPATGEEVLYAYQNAYDTAEYITPSSLVTKKINWTIYIDDGENLGADIHKKMVFCSVEDLDEHNDLEGAHEPAFTAHNADTGSHTDIRNKIGTDISSHNTSTSAHTDIRNKIGTDISSHNTSTSAHTDIRNKIGTDISSHNKSTSAHTDIRNKIGTDISSHNTSTSAHTDIRNKIGTDISSHNTSTSAHTDIRNKIGTDISSHNKSTSAHTDIRNKIGTDISSHNTSTSAHTDIRNKIQTVQQNASLFMLPVKRNTTYAVGDCASATGLPSWAYLECVTAGTTANTEPLFGGGRVADGTCVWIIKDVRCPYSLGEFVFKMNEPKDYEYLLLCDGSTISEENYPELVAVLGGTQLPNLIDRFLQGSVTAGTYKAAGLPNITGNILDNCFGHLPGGTGAIITNGQVSYNYTHSGTVINFYGGVSFDASRSNSIYGNSTTVQPPAFTTKIYICYAG